MGSQMGAHMESRRDFSIFLETLTLEDLQWFCMIFRSWEVLESMKNRYKTNTFKHMQQINKKNEQELNNSILGGRFVER